MSKRRGEREGEGEGEGGRESRIVEGRSSWEEGEETDFHDVTHCRLFTQTLDLRAEQLVEGEDEKKEEEEKEEGREGEEAGEQEKSNAGRRRERRRKLGIRAGRKDLVSRTSPSGEKEGRDGGGGGGRGREGERRKGEAACCEAEK